MTEKKKLGAFSPLLEGAEERLWLFDNSGADLLMAEDVSKNDGEHEESIGRLKGLIRACDAWFLAGGRVKRVEDVKKYLYAGAKMVYLKASQPETMDLLKEVSDRFGREKIAVWLDKPESLAHAAEYEALGAGAFLLSGKECPRTGISYPVYLLTEEGEKEGISALLSIPGAAGVILTGKAGEETSFMERKAELSQAGIPVEIFRSSVSWEEFQLGPDGLLPVIVQDYRTNEVLMMAYMNELAFSDTLRTGRMCYYSRSRKSQWLKGETSGHFQYVKSLHLDCDNDTLLAKVSQVGAACHTGSRSCFFQTLVKKEYSEANPLQVFEKVYEIIQDRKLHPKEGSYTNYLFDKGIDKILKKVGEEATEIIIAAKNPDPEEIIYELSDFLYHAMVLMAQKGVTWEEVTRELANR
ncbi:MAG: bifunctional phosphoribosyl-AMP cyclohydrolase/phosphoribosyl-ATP diphosphatase HisIE [Lachnospiraceae bacterium]|jgi:phosphoribosyl-ATP pyrophosphohydrolase/phosphoribosyl-AMP cyclohydrolase|nr:bifunctional phosphoribosyl-AMP cyclohydrolase/phosphoribosyl-ATP diphosphatase HisIE [Lachnospiraceae bacterium]